MHLDMSSWEYIYLQYVYFDNPQVNHLLEKISKVTVQLMGRISINQTNGISNSHDKHSVLSDAPEKHQNSASGQHYSTRLY